MDKTYNNTKKKNTPTKKGSSVIKSDNRDSDSGNKYLMSGAWRIVPMNKTGITRLVEDLYSWIERNPDELCFEQFLKMNKIGHTAYYRWIKEHPELQEAHEFVLMCIGLNRERGALTKRLDGSFVQVSMPIYSPAWKKVIEWRESIKKPREDILSASKIVVNMTKYDESDIVPVKKKDYTHEEEDE